MSSTILIMTLLLRFYAAKDEEEDSDSDEEEDEVLDFHKQKSEVIFWNDPRIRLM